MQEMRRRSAGRMGRMVAIASANVFLVVCGDRERKVADLCVVVWANVEVGCCVLFCWDVRS